MNTSSDSSSLFPHTQPDSNHARTYINPILWFDDCDGYRVVFCRHEILYRVALDDPLHLALVAVTLRQSELATQGEIAAAFGHSVATQRRWETRYQQHGSDGLQANAPTGRPGKLDRAQQAFIERWFQQGVSNHEMARRLAVSEATIRRALATAGLRRPRTPAVELPFPAEPATPAEPPESPALAGSAATAAELPAQADPGSAELANLPSSASSPAPAEALTPKADFVPVGPSHAPAETSRAAATSAPVAAVGVEEVAPPGSGPVPDVPAEPPAPLAAPQPAAPANVLTVDCDPADRCGDRTLARLGFLQDAAPLFGDHQELPRAGVLLAIPILQAHGGLEVFLRLHDSLGPAFYGLRTTVLSLILLSDFIRK